MREKINDVDCVRTFKILYNQEINSGVCWVCWKRSGRIDTGCNCYNEKAIRNWKHYRRFQYKQIGASANG